jgi:hypothetical protein
LFHHLLDFLKRMNAPRPGIGNSPVNRSQNRRVVIGWSMDGHPQFLQQQSLILGAELLDGGADFGDRAHGDKIEFWKSGSKVIHLSFPLDPSG